MIIQDIINFMTLRVDMMHLGRETLPIFVPEIRKSLGDVAMWLVDAGASWREVGLKKLEPLGNNKFVWKFRLVFKLNVYI